MKLQAFPGCSGATVAGEQIIIEKDGSCEVSPAAAKELIESHGFVPFGAQKKAAEAVVIQDKFTDMGRSDLIGYIKGKGLPITPNTSNVDLMGIARAQYSPEERAADEAAAAEAAKTKA